MPLPVAGIESPLDELVDVETDSEIHQEDAAIVRRAAGVPLVVNVPPYNAVVAPV
jgi:hypothetical protein